MSAGMYRVEASSLGALTGTGPWAGRVLSVHPRAINILREDGLMVSVLADRSAMSAMGILARTLFESLPDARIVDAGARFEPGLIIVDTFALVGCGKCPTWEGHVGKDAFRLVPAHVIHAVRDSLLVHGIPGGFLGILRNDKTDNPFVVRALKFLADGRLEEVIGCGPGLTPAGDDFLTGALLASPASFVPDRARLGRLLAGTTPAGRTLLWMALQGRFPAYLLSFIGAIAEDEASADGIGGAVRAACAHGDTSGTDALAGFCWQMLQSMENMGNFRSADKDLGERLARAVKTPR